MEFSVVNGIITKSATKSKKLIGKTDFLHILKQMLDRLHITYTDVCCPESGFTPVRFNKNLLRMEYLDFDTQTWLAVP